MTFAALARATARLLFSAGLCGLSACATHDVVIRNGLVYDGSGAAPYVGDVVVDGRKIRYAGPSSAQRGRVEIDAKGLAVAPGFINMLSWANESMVLDGRAQSDLRQGVTLEVFGEGTSMGPLNDAMKRSMLEHQGDLRFDVNWTTLDEYLRGLRKQGIAPNVASFVGATTVRVHVLGEGDVDPTAQQLDQMKQLVRRAMEDGALGVGASLIYAPASFAETPELTALAAEAGRCGGMYTAHIRSEGNHFLEAVDETVQIARDASVPAEIYHLKAVGRGNWHKLPEAVARIEAANRAGLRVTANMYPYIEAWTGLDAAMPTWVQEGGLDAWFERLKDPAIRARVMAEMRSTDTEWENNFQAAGGGAGILLIGFKSEALKPLTGKTLEEIARMRGVSAEEAALDLVVEDRSRVDTIYFAMSEDNVHRMLKLPYVSFGSDAPAPAPEGAFLLSSTHPRSYGTFARVLGHYVRDENALTLQDAVRRMTSLPAGNLGLHDRGRLGAGAFADIVVFDAATISDPATFVKPHQFATGVRHVLVNGKLALRDGEPTGAATGEVVRGRGWTGWADGGCRRSGADWNRTPILAQ